MAKFRKNHNQQASKSGTMITKVGIFGGLMAALLFAYNLFSGKSADDRVVDEVTIDESFLPSVKNGTLVRHHHYILSYDEDNEQAEWTAHILTKEDLDKEWHKRSGDFREDPLVKTGSAELSDYRGSGYDRGHLVPSADMAWDEEAMSETFYLSNMSPQSHDFNKGIWRELEELTRSWAKKYKKLYVITGPILGDKNKGTIGANKVTVPTAYYKVLLDLTDPERKAIAFVVPNEISYEPLFKYAHSVDEVEDMTGIDFFEDLMGDAEEDTLEGSYNLDLWAFNKHKFELRRDKWNK